MSDVVRNLLYNRLYEIDLELLSLEQTVFELGEDGHETDEEWLRLSALYDERELVMSRIYEIEKECGDDE